MNKLYKSRYDRTICGVCGGIAELLGVDSTIVRIVTAALVLAGGLSIWIYIIAAIIIPEAPAE